MVKALRFLSAYNPAPGFNTLPPDLSTPPPYMSPPEDYTLPPYTIPPGEHTFPPGEYTLPPGYTIPPFTLPPGAIPTFNITGINFGINTEAFGVLLVIMACITNCLACNCLANKRKRQRAQRSLSLTAFSSRPNI